MAFNKSILIGNLVATPELKQTQSGIPVTSFRLAVGRKTQKETDFIDIVAWRATAEFICRHFEKGNPILVCGSIQVRSWQDKDGNKRTTTEVVADEVSFVGGRQAKTDERQSNFEELINDDDLPF